MKRELEPLRIEARLVAGRWERDRADRGRRRGGRRFQSFDFNRDQINLPGEPGTGRLQVRLEVTVMVIEANRFKNLTFRMAFDDAAEVIDTLTGQSPSASSRRRLSSSARSRPVNRPRRAPSCPTRHGS